MLSPGSGLTCNEIGFLTEWQLYCQLLEGDNWRDQKLDKAKLDKMSGAFIRFPGYNLSRDILTYATDQQVGQLYELMQAIRKQELEENDPENHPKQ